MREFSRELDTATRAAREAGVLIRKNVSKAKDVRSKGTHDLVTATDEAAEALIIEHLQESFPEYDILAEEGAAGGSHRPGRPRWIIDPLDGTTNFTHSLPPYCVSIALQDEEGELVLGVIHEITQHETFSAVRGRGAHIDGRPIRASETDRLDDALITTGFPFREFGYVDDYLPVLRRFMLETRGVRRPGSAAADLAYVACGRFDAFFEAGLAPWDVAAGIVLVREAGGRVAGLARGFDPLTDGQIVAAGPGVFDAIREIAKPLGEAYANHRRMLNEVAAPGDTRYKGGT